MLKKCVVCLAVGMLLWAGPAMAMGNNRAVYTPKPRNPGKYVPWECSFESERVPPLDTAVDALFQEARTLQRTLIYPTEGEKMHIFSLYKQAAKQGHWKAI